MASVDKVRVGNTDYEMAGFCKVYDTIAQMQADINNIPDGCMVYVKENSPSGLAGDAALDTVSTNWVQNKVVAQAINSLSSDIATKTPTILSKDLTNVFVSSAWGSLYSAEVIIDTTKDWRWKKVEVSYVPSPSNDTSAFAVIEQVTSSSIKVLLMRPTSAAVTGTLYAFCYD